MVIRNILSVQNLLISTNVIQQYRYKRPRSVCDTISIYCSVTNRLRRTRAMPPVALAYGLVKLLNNENIQLDTKKISTAVVSIHTTSMVTTLSSACLFCLDK
jgi:hypothetical protein